MANTKCIMIHGCPSSAEQDPVTRTYDKHWMPWTKKELEKAGIKVEAPVMPEPWQPDYNKFKAEFEKLSVDESTILIGHSCGCAFLVHWLGESKQQVKKLILVAPWKVNDHGKQDTYREEFYGFEIDNSIKDRVGEITMFTADDEEEEGKESLKMYNGALGGNIISLDSHGHYTMGDMGTDEFPELIQAILK